MGKAVVVIAFDERESSEENMAVFDTLKKELEKAELDDALYYMAIREVADEILTIFDPDSPLVHKNAFHDVKDRKELLGQLAGAASICWENPEGAGVFESDKAAKFVDDAFTKLNELDMSSHDEGTLGKVHKALMEAGAGDRTAREAIISMQNAGILFRERK